MEPCGFRSENCRARPAGQVGGQQAKRCGPPGRRSTVADWRRCWSGKPSHRGPRDCRSGNGGLVADHATLRRVGHGAAAHDMRADDAAAQRRQRQFGDALLRFAPGRSSRRCFMHRRDPAGAGGKLDFGHGQQGAPGRFPEHLVERVVEQRRAVVAQPAPGRPGFPDGSRRAPGRADAWLLANSRISRAWASPQPCRVVEKSTGCSGGVSSLKPSGPSIGSLFRKWSE